MSRCSPRDLRWNREHGTLSLHLGNRRKPLLCVIPDTTHPGMWRIKFQTGNLSDMVNLSRAKDAARAIATSMLIERTPQTAAGGLPIS